MKVNYDAGTDTLTVILRDALVAESDEDKPGIILDYDDVGNLVSIEVLNASKHVSLSRTRDRRAVYEGPQRRTLVPNSAHLAGARNQRVPTTARA